MAGRPGGEDEVQAAQSVIAVGVHPALLAMTRDGRTLYVVNSPDQS